MPNEMTWDEFERRLVKAGWTKRDAKRERHRQEHGDLGDCDGDLAEIEAIAQSRSKRRGKETP